MTAPSGLAMFACQVFGRRLGCIEARAASASSSPFFLAVHPVSETALRLWSHAGLAGMRQADFACALTESFVTASRLSCKNLD